MTKTSAINRIHELLDDNSFVEVGAYITARSTDYNMQSQETPADGRTHCCPGRLCRIQTPGKHGCPGRLRQTLCLPGNGIRCDPADPGCVWKLRRWNGCGI